MLSRVAEAIYWMARYVERAENLARFVDVTLNMTLDQPIGARQQWEPLVLATGDEKYFYEHYDSPSAETVMQFLVFDRQYPNSILSSLQFARENARSVRETISSEMWEQLNAFYHHVRDAELKFATIDSPSDFLCSVKDGSHLFNGIADATMSHDAGWHFANLGRVIERADKTSRMLDVKYFTLLPALSDVGTPIDDLQWADVLRSVRGFQSYRRRYHEITVERIIDFLILDRMFPRAIHFCIREADASLHAISGTMMGTFRNSAERLFGQLRAELDFRQIDTIRSMGLHEYIDSLQIRLNEASEAIHETFFAIRPVEEAVTGQFQSQK